MVVKQSVCFNLIFQALASFLLVLGESEEAGVAMERSLSLWLPQHTAWAATGEGEQTNLSYDTRLASVKVLLDLERFDTAAEILDSLLEEDNEVNLRLSISTRIYPYCHPGCGSMVSSWLAKLSPK